MSDQRQISFIRSAQRASKLFLRLFNWKFDESSLPPPAERARRRSPSREFGSGVFEIAIKHRGDAFRAVYAVQIGAAIWVIHAFQKKSKTGIKTPQVEIDLIRERLRRLQSELR